MMYLSEQHDGQFMPATRDSKRGQFLQWMFYLMSAFQPEVLIQFKHNLMTFVLVGRRLMLGGSFREVNRRR